jgi:hypothetical protein
MTRTTLTLPPNNGVFDPCMASLHLMNASPTSIDVAAPIRKVINWEMVGDHLHSIMRGGGRGGIVRWQSINSPISPIVVLLLHAAVLYTLTQPALGYIA